MKKADRKGGNTKLRVSQELDREAVGKRRCEWIRQVGDQSQFFFQRSSKNFGSKDLVVNRALEEETIFALTILELLGDSWREKAVF